MSRGSEGDGWVEVYRGTERRRWLEFALVLEALGFDHWMEQEEENYRLLVAAQQGERALRELAEYEAEADEPPPLAPQVPQIGSGSGFLPGYWCALLTCYGFDRFRVFGFDWLEAGRAHARLIVQGEWWRTVTALTLHADGSHLLNNLVFGSLFGVLLGLCLLIRAPLGLFFNYMMGFTAALPLMAAFVSPPLLTGTPWTDPVTLACGAALLGIPVLAGPVRNKVRRVGAYWCTAWTAAAIVLGA